MQDALCKCALQVDRTFAFVPLVYVLKDPLPSTVIV